MRVVAVIPTYNEVESLEAVVKGIRAALPDVSIVVVDDGSSDGTGALARRLGDELGALELLTRPAKLGLGSAYRDGFRRAIDTGAEICVQIDADLSHDPQVLPALVANVEYGADLAIGSRYVPGGATESWPDRRRWLSRWGNRYAAGVLGLAVNDATSGYRAYRTTALEAMDFPTVRTDGYGFQIEMTHRLVRSSAVGSSSSRSCSGTARPESRSCRAGSSTRRSGSSPACGTRTVAVAVPGEDEVVSPARAAP